MAEKSSDVRSSCIMILVGAVTAYLAVWNLFIKPADISKFTATATDAVVAHVYVRRDDGDEYYTPCFSFSDSDHRDWTVESVVEYEKEYLKAGDTVTVRYNPFDPEAGCIVEGHEGRLTNHAFVQYLQLAFGIVLAGSGVWSLAKEIQDKLSKRESS